MSLKKMLSFNKILNLLNIHDNKDKWYPFVGLINGILNLIKKREILAEYANIYELKKIDVLHFSSVFYSLWIWVNALTCSNIYNLWNEIFKYYESLKKEEEKVELKNIKSKYIDVFNCSLMFRHTNSDTLSGKCNFRFNAKYLFDCVNELIPYVAINKQRTRELQQCISWIYKKDIANNSDNISFKKELNILLIGIEDFINKNKINFH